eukprot:COSAG01_NODE_37702_length_500_cov_0.411471_1_plen_99_part_10
MAGRGGGALARLREALHLGLGLLWRGVDAQHDRARLLPPGRGRCVSMFLDRNRRHIGESQPERPPKQTQRPPHRPCSMSQRGERGMHAMPSSCRQQRLR